MSHFLRMSVQGIRSFGPDDKDKQVMVFYPFTLILGPNGSGKTTLIECLRYMTTGDMPPNSKGVGFVFDPKLANKTSQVKGQIRLQFRDVQGRKVTVIRSLVATQKEKNVSLRTLDSTIEREGPDGEMVSITSKCADIDKEMVAALGVCKAVLTNVMFCHQEDSNWPLGESNALKVKFDEIFDASRYIKALDVIKKVRLDKKREAELLQRDVAHLKEKKIKATQIESELKTAENRLVSAQGRVQEIIKRLSPYKSELDEIQKKEHEIYEIEMKFNQVNIILSEKQKKCSELQSRVSSICSNKGELESKIKSFHSDLSQKENELTDVKKKCETNDRHIKRAESKKFEMQREIAKLEAFEEQHKTKVQERNDKLRSLASMLPTCVRLDTQDTLDESSINATLQRIKDEVGKLEKEKMEATKKYKDTSEEFQSKVDCLRMEVTRSEQAIEMNQATVAMHQSEIDSLNDKVKRVTSSSSSLYEIDMNIVCLQSELDSILKRTDVQSLTDEISKLKARKSLLETDVSVLSKQLDILQRENGITTEISLQEKEKTMREEKMQKMIRRHSDVLCQLLGDVPTRSLQQKISAFIFQCEQEINTLLTEQAKQRRKLTTLQTSRDLGSKELKRKEEDLNRFQEEVMKACGMQDFNECLEALQSTMNDLQNDKGALIGSRFLFTKYMQKVEADDCCPLCHRGFQEKSESEELVSELKQQLSMLPYKLDRQEKLLKEKQQKLHELLALKPVLKNVEQLSKEIPELRKKLTSQSEEINQIQSQLSELDKEYNSKQGDLQTAQSISKDCILFDQAQGDLQQINEKISALKSKLSDDVPTKPMDILRSERISKQNELGSINEKIERNQKDVNTHYEEMQKIKEQINHLKETKLQLNTEVQQQAAFEEHLSKLEGEKRNLERTIQNAGHELREKKRNLETLIQETADARKTSEFELQMITERLSQLQVKLNAVVNLTLNIYQYERQGKSSELAQCQREMMNMDEALRTFHSERDSLLCTQAQLQKDISSYQLREHELQDNMQLLLTREETASLEEKLQSLQEKRGNVSARTFLQRKKELEKLIQQLSSEQQQIEGRHQELKLQVIKLKNELNEDIYKNAHTKYAHTNIDYQTTLIAVRDLEKYYHALDNAVMSYHSKKMSEINQLIQDLWRSAYDGDDIDYIEIRSDDQGGSSLEKRRNYNYRVVMVKQDVAMDMRGRCSAGQKVLASIIIRLALAEAFCINCGVLALDEPTTNLDKHHIKKLAEALQAIAKNRYVQRNFQLLVITHDEAFIELLAKGQPVEYIQCIKKDKNHHSTITKTRISDAM